MAAKEKFVVTGEQYRDIDKKMAEIKRQMNQRGGSSLDPFLISTALQRIVECDFGRHCIIDCDRKPHIPDGWEIRQKDQLKNRVTGQFRWVPDNVDLYLSEGQKGYRCIEGHELLKELEGQPVLDANVLDFLLAHRELIPEEWKKGKYIFFWGTVYRSRHGGLFVRYLYGFGYGWDWHYRWFDGGWLNDYPAAVRAS